jgi:hypothetical protein
MLYLVEHSIIGAKTLQRYGATEMPDSVQHYRDGYGGGVMSAMGRKLTLEVYLGATA